MAVGTSHAVQRIRASSLRPAGTLPPRDVIPMNMGEPDFATPAAIVDAAVDALRQGYTHYGDLNGDPELRELIASQASSVAGRRIDPKCVLVSHGGAAGITASIMAIVDPGDRVLIPEPTYSLYVDAVQMAGGVPVFIANRSDHHLDLAEISARAKGARMLILCNPVNPTGAVFNASELAQLDSILDPSTTVLVDEAYAYLVYGDAGFVPALAIEALQSRLIYVQTLSKTYAMTGWRLGYVIGSPEVSADIQLIHRTMNSAVNAMVQRAAIAALRAGERIAHPMLVEYRKRREYVIDRVARMNDAQMVAPEGAFYAFVRYPGSLPSTEVVSRLMAGGVAVRAGSEYGPSGEGHVRLSFATGITALEEGLNRIERVFKSLD